MIPPALEPYLPHLALGIGVLAVAVLLYHAIKRRGLLRRPVLLVATLLSALPGLYVGLVWARVMPESYVRMGRPGLAPLAFIAMVVVALRLASHGARWSAFRRVLADTLISVALLASALAATVPEIGRPLDRLTIIIVLDRSRSIDLVPNAEQRVARELAVAEQGMREHDMVGTVVFAAGAATEQPPRPKSDTPSVQRVEIGRDGTDLAAGLKRALAEMPADSAARVVLLSDGVPTRGDAMSAAAAAVASDIPVDVIALEQREMADVRVVSFRVTPRASEGEAIGMRVVTSSPKETEVELRIKRNGKLVGRHRATIGAGEDVVRIPTKAPLSGLHRYDVEITALDKSLDETAEDNSASSFVRVRGAARALVLDGDSGTTGFIASALTSANFRVEEGSTSALPADIDGMAGYDLIVMGDIPAKDLAPRQIEALASYVRELGGGVLLTGGDRSFGPGGYARTPLEEISPVAFDLKQERRRASLAEVIAVDISGSMGMRVGANTKLELANEGAARSAELLGPGDHLGVLHVDTRPNWSVPLAPVKDKKAIEQAIRAVGPGGGGIYCDVALQEAYGALRGAKVNLKHVLLFADGSDAENITPAVQGMVSQAAKDGITTSCVSLGRGHHSAPLEDLSRRGGGRFYIVEDASRLPAVFTQETILASRSAVVEKTFSVGLSASTSITRGIDFKEAPSLDGYVVTIPKGRSTVMLSGPENDPILAVWSAGVGRAAVFTSDLKDRWGSRWTSWPGAATMVAQAARDVARREDDKRVRLEASATGGQLHLRATVVDDDGRMQSFRRLSVRVQGPDGIAHDVALDAAGSGTYSATVPLERPGAYIAVARDDVSGKPVATTGAALTAGEELRPTGTDHALLARLAELTGGKQRDTLAGIFRDRAARRFAYQDVTMQLLLLAAFALLLAIAARRLSIPSAAYSWVGRAARWRPWAHRPEGAPAPGGATAMSTLDHLLERKGDTERQPEAADEPITSDGAASETPQPHAHAGAAASPAGHASATEQLAARRGARARRPAQPTEASQHSAPERSAPKQQWRPPPQPAAVRQPEPAAKPVEPTRPAAAPATPPAEGERPKTAAEILLERRRKKRR